MAKTFNEELFDAMLRHQIGILRYSGSVRNRIWRLLDATEADLKREILRRAQRAGFDTSGRRRNLETLLRNLRETRLKGWNGATAAWGEEMRALALAEPGFLDRLIVGIVPVHLGTVVPDAAVLRNIVNAQPFRGKTLSEWGKDMRRADLDRIESAVKVGLVQGEHPRQIARRIVGTAALRGRDGATQITRRGAAAITRTVTSGIAAEARRAYAEANKDIAPQELFTATLDSRTTPVCRGFDGQLFDVGKGPVLPLHIGERSVYSPVLDGEVIGERPVRNFTQRQLVREFGKREGIKVRVPRGETLNAGRKAIPRGHKGAFDKFARERMRELTGTAPAKTSYGQWLSGQSATFQNDILGKTRGALFRSGGLELDKFVEFDGTELTLAQLAARHESAFIQAGLDPSAFRP